VPSRLRQGRESRPAEPDHQDSTDRRDVPDHHGSPVGSRVRGIAHDPHRFSEGPDHDGHVHDGHVHDGHVHDGHVHDGEARNTDAHDGDAQDGKDPDDPDSDEPGDGSGGSDAPLTSDFDGFGAALVADVITPRFVRRQLDGALRKLLRSSSLPPGFMAEITSAGVDSATLLSDDGHERCFRVIVVVELEADVGPRVFALGVDAEVNVELTVRVRAFRPATVGFDIDPVTPDDVWFRARTRSGWLPFSLGDGGRAGLTRSAARAVPSLCATVNRELEASLEQRRVDVLAYLQAYGTGAADGRRAGRRARAGRPIGFAELGEVLLRRGVDRRVVATAVESQLAEPIPVRLDGPVPVRGAVVLKLVDVVPMAGEADELLFRLSMLADAELMVGEDAKQAPVTATVRADVPMRLRTLADPATLVVEFDPISRLRVMRARRAVRGRMVTIPVPNRTLAWLRRRVVDEVDARLRERGLSMTGAELVDRVLSGAAQEPVGVDGGAGAD